MTTTLSQSGIPPRAAGRPRRQRIASSRNHGGWVEMAPGVWYLTIGFVNAYAVGDPAGRWVLVDTGLPGTHGFTRAALARRWGADARPSAIVLTHGHFDHAGSARALAEAWDVPVYAGPLELPYLTGRSDYPPRDPSMGGAIAQMSRLFPTSGIDLRGRVHALPDDGTVPEMQGWRWLHTPGHTSGHVSLFRAADGVLIAGDALATLDMDAWASHVTEHRELDRPAAPFTTDWQAARRSVGRLADLAPSVIGAGHGIPLAGAGLARDLRLLAATLPVPAHGRYVARPARADESGVVWVPPPVPDPLLPRLAVAGAAAAAVLLLARAARRR
ncbi:MBL fold metallo-hydrolase [Longimicrobium sp.]|uniref:MBL fold metallo-hydrolase n=1 Tax=Longimicrobium sp. TaxID=2029185 RepID=UPI002E378683|nr:MBL fold metallo-hydrolase [Longimicrobium sp.]HEX6038019.1 MBL fold metallo-hydrolase [Longimicrobium sp.]